ncbi:MAG: hypothetical protein IT536_13840 [Hyphomicrobiales bacterium]|nr:hypothetical protein [Hyphomicrobiales bacterium]
MSTIPLSIREGRGRTSSGDDPHVCATADRGHLDALIERVTETITGRAAARAGGFDRLLETTAGAADGQSWTDLKADIEASEAAQEIGAKSALEKSPLDQALKTAVDRCAGQESESADFHRSRPWREALARRYQGRVAIGDLFESFAQWHQRLLADPASAADAIAAAYLEQPLNALPQDATADGGIAEQATSERQADHSLDRVLGAAIDRHHGDGDREQQTFADIARHRFLLKSMFPGLSFTEACRRLVTLDGALHRDPVATATRLALSYGLAIEPPSEKPAVAGAVDDAEDVVTSLVRQLPDLMDLEDEILAVLQRPAFRHGPDLRRNLIRAYGIARHARHAQQAPPPQA